MASQPTVNIMSSSVQFHFECDTCGKFGHFWVDPKKLKDGQIRANGSCDVCDNAVAGFSEESAPGTRQAQPSSWAAAVEAGRLPLQDGSRA